MKVTNISNRFESGILSLTFHWWQKFAYVSICIELGSSQIRMHKMLPDILFQLFNSKFKTNFGMYMSFINIKSALIVSGREYATARIQLNRYGFYPFGFVLFCVVHCY